jgi:hypothetical protein
VVDQYQRLMRGLGGASLLRHGEIVAEPYAVR